MYETIRLTEHDYYVDCPAKIGLVQTGPGEAVLIDSGSDKDAAKKVWRILGELGLSLRAIYATHSHADHIGGCRFLQEKSGCPVYARGLERCFTEAPVLEPLGLFGGAPLPELRGKFLMAQPSDVLPLTEDTLPEGWTLLPLPGHSFDMTGFLTPDGTAYVADAVSSPETLAKYGIGYLWDPAASLETLEMLGALRAARFVPAHAAVCEDIAPLCELNAAAIRDVRARVTALLRTPLGFEELLARVFESYGLTMNLTQYALIGSTLRNYLTDLRGRGEVACEIAESRLLWKAVTPDED